MIKYFIYNRKNSSSTYFNQFLTLAVKTGKVNIETTLKCLSTATSSYSGLILFEISWFLKKIFWNGTNFFVLVPVWWYVYLKQETKLKKFFDVIWKFDVYLIMKLHPVRRVSNRQPFAEIFGISSFALFFLVLSLWPKIIITEIAVWGDILCKIQFWNKKH